MMTLVDIMTMLYQRLLFLKDIADYDDDSEEDNNSCHTVLTNN